MTIESLQHILQCPFCSASLNHREDNFTCTDCQTLYEITEKGQCDLRLKQDKDYPLTFQLKPAWRPPTDLTYDFEKASLKNGSGDYQGPIPHHLTKDLVACIPRGGSGRRILDLGCGNGVHRPICETLGYQYVGIDYQSQDAMFLGDAHALPFVDNSFDCVLCVAVLEHIRIPFVAMKEIARVLKPGGRVIGTVSFLEPFHDNSFYHHTHLAVLNDLESASLDVKAVVPNHAWPGLLAQAKMSLFSKLPKWLCYVLVAPLLGLHRFWWFLGRTVLRSEGASEKNRRLNTSGSFFFVADKSSDTIC